MPHVSKNMEVVPWMDKLLLPQKVVHVMRAELKYLKARFASKAPRTKGTRHATTAQVGFTSL